MILAANFKTNKTRAATEKYIEHLSKFLSDRAIGDEVMIFPPASAFVDVSAPIVQGAQNAWPTHNGAFTGEIGTEQLEEFGIETVLVGHSERRHILGETQDRVVEKFDFFKAEGYRIVYCIGEPLEVREDGNDALMAYLADQCEGIDLAYEKLVLAYEPVWAIGTGRVPKVNEIERIHGALAQMTDAPLLYGGSVKTSNASEILAIEHVDGALIGSGALAVEDFCAIIENAQHINKGV